MTLFLRLEICGKMTQLFFQSFCTKKWPCFFLQSFCTKKWPNFFSNLFAVQRKKTLGPVPLIYINMLIWKYFFLEFNWRGGGRNWRRGCFTYWTWFGWWRRCTCWTWKCNDKKCVFFYLFDFFFLNLKTFSFEIKKYSFFCFFVADFQPAFEKLKSQIVNEYNFMIISIPKMLLYLFDAILFEFRFFRANRT